jgi:hypothetical protein
MSVDPFVHADGAYVLGALDAAERAEFEAHLTTCDACRARVDEVRPTVALLAGLAEDAFTDAAITDAAFTDDAFTEPMPDTLLPGLLRRAKRERSRRRLLTASVGSLAAACLVALAILVWPTSSSSPSAPTARALTPVRPSPVSATAALVSKKWGTEIDLTCRYAEEVEAGRPYELRVVDKANIIHPAGSWILVPGHALTWKGGTDVPRDDISKVLITLPDGTAILQLKV